MNIAELIKHHEKEIDFYTSKVSSCEMLSVFGEVNEDINEFKLKLKFHEEVITMLNNLVVDYEKKNKLCKDINQVLGSVQLLALDKGELTPYNL